MVCSTAQPHRDPQQRHAAKPTMMASLAGKHPQEEPGNSNTPVPEQPREVRPFDFYTAQARPAPAFNGEARPTLANGHSGNAAKPPRPPAPVVKPARSDSELSDIPDANDGSDFEAGEEMESDYSDDDSGSKRRRAAGRDISSRKRMRTPEDNDMRRKLRGNTPQQEGASEEKSHVSETEAGSEVEEDDPTAVPERVVASEEEREQKEMLKTSWELISVLDFLSTFHPYMASMANLQFSAEELESALVLSNGTGGLLADLHIALLKGISSRSAMHYGNWTASLAEKLKLYWRLGQLPGRPPFACQRRREAATYATLPLQNRVTALRILCELRLDREDLHNVVEHALHPPKKTKAERKALAAAEKAGRKLYPEPQMPTMEQMRREPLALDSSGLMYWYLDYHNTTGTRMYRETPGSLLKAKAKDEPHWELIATSPEELTEVGERLRRSKKKPDQTLADQILDVIIPELLERREADLRKQRMAARVRTQLNNILANEGGYAGRSRRTRKEVNYSFDAYDAAIKAALRGGRGHEEGEPRTTRSAALLEPRLTAEEEAQIGLRRGRSAHGPEHPGDLPPHRRSKHRSDGGPDSVDGASNAASAERSPAPAVEPTPVPSSHEPTPPQFDAGGLGGRELRDPWAAQADWPHHEDANGGARESVEVEISEMGSREEYQGGSLDAGDEDISSLEAEDNEADLEYEDDPMDKDWR